VEKASLKTKLSKWREKSDADLEAELDQLVEERFRLRFRSATEAIEDPMRFRSLRRDIARIRTVLRERADQTQG
jgi:large subunit ribosomal protein L29